MILFAVYRATWTTMELFGSLWQLANFANLLPAAFYMSLVLLALVIAARVFLGRAIRRNDKLTPEVRRRWLVTVRNGTMLLLVLALMIIWAEELRVAAVSMLAIAVATVIATKELITCISGSILKTASRGFTVGDRIEINDFRGDVIDHNALTTTILEIGPQGLTQQHTGRAIVLPNCMFLDSAVVNETFTHDYVLHVFKVPVPMNSDWQHAEQDLLTAANESCRPFLNDARLHFQRLGNEQGIRTLSVEPRVTVLIPSPGELELVVRLAVPARKKGRIEQAILRQFVASCVARGVVHSAGQESNTDSSHAA